MQPLQQLYTCNHGLMYRVIFLTNKHQNAINIYHISHAFIFFQHSTSALPLALSFHGAHETAMKKRLYGIDLLQLLEGVLLLFEAPLQ